MMQIPRVGLWSQRKGNENRSEAWKREISLGIRKIRMYNLESSELGGKVQPNCYLLDGTLSPETDEPKAT